jgi:predicted TIM-barrel fold metal-dependent hydrolase
MIVDFHTHVFPDRIAAGALAKLSQIGGVQPHTDGTADGLRDSMVRCGVDYSVVQPVATSINQVRSINDFSASLNGIGGLIAFGGIHPGYEAWKEELSRIKELGLPGVKLHPYYQNTFIDDQRYIDIIKECGKIGLIVLTHAGIDIGYPEIPHCTPERVRSILPEIKGTVFICAHFGGHRFFEDSIRFLADTDVYIDTSYSHTEYAEQCKRVLEAFDEDHILFGSDSPWTDQKESVSFIQSLGYPPEKTEKILWKNAARLLGLR